MSEYHRAYYAKNKARIRARQKHYYAVHKTKIRTRQKHYYAKNTTKILAQCRKYVTKNRPQVRVRNRAYYVKNRLRLLTQNRVYRLAHREECLARAKKYGAIRRATPHGAAYEMGSRLRKGYGPFATLAADYLYRQQGGRSYLTGAPLLAPVVEHCHTSNELRGICNEIDNAMLSRNCGDSYAGCIERLARLKNPNGKLAQWIKAALPGLRQTPAMKAKIRFVVTGRYASHKYTAHQRRVHNLENLVSLIKAGVFKNSSQQQHQPAAA